MLEMSLSLGLKPLPAACRRLQAFQFKGTPNGYHVRYLDPRDRSADWHDRAFVEKQTREGVISYGLSSYGL